jgi:hypothetical protein
VMAQYVSVVGQNLGQATHLPRLAGISDSDQIHTASYMICNKEGTFSGLFL